MQSDGTTTTIMPTPSGSSRGDLSAVASVGSTLFAVGSQTNDATTLQSQGSGAEPTGTSGGHPSA